MFVRARTAIGHLPPVVWRILLHSMLFGLAISVTDLLFNFYLVSLGYAADVAGLLSTANHIAGVALGLPMGLMIDRVGARRALLFGLLLYSGAWALLLLSGVLWLLVLAQFLIGGAQILALTAVVPLLAEVTDSDRRAMVFGLNASAAMVIGLVGSAIGGLLPTLAAIVLGSGPQDAVAYRLALASVVALGLVAGLPVLKRFPHGEHALRAAAEETLKRAVSTRTLVRYALPYLLLGLGGGAFLPFQNLFFRQQFGLGDASVGVVLAWSSLGLGLGAVLGSPLSARIGMQQAATFLRMGAVPAMLLMLIPVLPAALGGFFLRGLFVAASFPLNDALMMQEIPARQRGIATSLMSVLWSLGWSVAAAVSGWAQLRWGFGPIIVTVAVAYALSGLAIATLRVAHRPPTPPSET